MGQAEGGGGADADEFPGYGVAVDGGGEVVLLGNRLTSKNHQFLLNLT